MESTNIIEDLNELIATVEDTKNQLVDQILSSGKVILSTLKSGKKLLVCGNGGSSAQASHFAGELLMRFDKDRKSLPAICLNSDISTITGGANDYGYENIFSRQVESLAQKGDILVGLTTSGNSPNVINALKIAKEKGVITICLNGKSGGKITPDMVDHNIIIPSNTTARIQELHINIIHMWCKAIDEEFA